VVALGIGSGITQAQLNAIASAPQSENVIRAADFSSLTGVTEQVSDIICGGQ